MGEAFRRALEARRQQHELAPGLLGGGCGVALELVLHDLLDAPDVVEFEVEGPPAGGLEPRAAVLVGQPQELLALAQLGPGEVTREKLLEETPDVSALAVALTDQRVGVPARVGGEFLGVVVVVRGALALAHGLVGLDALAVDVDAHELRIATHPHLLSHVAGGNRVEALSELDVVVGVHLGLGPHGGIEAPGHERPQLRFLLVLEHDQGTPSGGAVRALAGDLDAPADGLALDMVAIQPRLTAEEALAQILHVALDHGLSRGVASHGGVDDEAPVRGVLGEGALEDGVVAVGLRDRRLEVVELLFPPWLCDERVGP
jgi:hypothetical protein